MTVEYVLRVDNPRRTPCYLWGDRFTSDLGTATRFPVLHKAWEAHDAVSTFLHLDDRILILSSRKDVSCKPKN